MGPAQHWAVCACASASPCSAALRKQPTAAAVLAAPPICRSRKPSCADPPRVTKPRTVSDQAAHLVCVRVHACMHARACARVRARIRVCVLACVRVIACVRVRPRGVVRRARRCGAAAERVRGRLSRGEAPSERLYAPFTSAGGRGRLQLRRGVAELRRLAEPVLRAQCRLRAVVAAAQRGGCPRAAREARHGCVVRSRARGAAPAGRTAPAGSRACSRRRAGSARERTACGAAAACRARRSARA
jgi:hypothetical protein